MVVVEDVKNTNNKGKLNRRLTVLRRCMWRIWGQIFTCAVAKPAMYKMLTRATSSMHPHHSAQAAIEGLKPRLSLAPPPVRPSSHADSDLVPLKISLLGDSQIGKTSFLVKYVGEEEKKQGVGEMPGLSTMDKTFSVEGARISYTIWEIEGSEKCQDYVPMACKDSVAIFFMFDLTSRCTLHSVVKWYKQARKYNQTAIPVLIGTKFDDFIQLPMDLQWTVASQARSYAKAFNATLFFSSAAYNINVNKIFKFITAKLFDLPYTVERNLNIGEPIIDF